MKAVILSLFLLASLGAFYCAPDPAPPAVSADTLKRLSLEGEKLVDEEVTKALYEIKQMKEVMARNKEKHTNLMKSLSHSGEKKKGATEIAHEVEKKLNEEEQQCKDSSFESSWEECRPCLEDTCKNFYTNTCRRGFTSFTNKLQNFFQRLSSHFGPRDAQAEVALNQSAENPDLEVVRIEDSFSNLLTKVGTLVNRSVVLVSHFHHELDQTLRKAFSPELQKDRESELVLKTSNEALDSALIQGVGLDDVLESFFDFGRSVLEEFGSQVFSDLHESVEKKTNEEKKLLPRFMQNRRLCRDLRRRSSECWQLQSKCDSCQGALFNECPGVRELHMELDEASQLLEVSKLQYEEVLGIVQRHTEDTISWLSNMASDFGWVTELANNNTSESIFSIATVVAQTEEGDSTPSSDTQVEVNILNSPTLTLTVPAGLTPQDPAFIQYVAQEALGMYKQMARHNDV